MDTNNRIIYTRQLTSDVAGSEWFSILAQIISSTLLFILIFGMSATVDVGHLREQVHNKFAILTGVLTQFIIMPLLGFVTVILLSGHGLSEPMAITLLIVTASPGGSYSNWFCSMFNADLALSVTMTAVSTMISCVMLPANLLLYVNAAFGMRDHSAAGDSESVLKNIDWVSLFTSLAIVILAIGLGLFCSFKISSHRFNRFANRLGSMSGILLIIFSGVVTALSGSTEAQIWGQPGAFYVGVTAPCLVGLFLATCFATIARLRRPEVVSVGVECCYQNVGIATSAAVAMFTDPTERGQALCIPLFYGLVEAIVLGLYCIICWKFGWTKAPRDEGFCQMIVTTYEVEDDSEHFDDAVEIDEERPNTGVNIETARRPWSFFRRRKRTSDAAQRLEEICAQTHTSPTARSTARRTSINSLNEGLESIVQDSITELVTFPHKKPIEYNRVRLSSDGENTQLTEVESSSTDGSPNSTSSVTERPNVLSKRYRTS